MVESGPTQTSKSPASDQSLASDQPLEHLTDSICIELHLSPIHIYEKFGFDLKTLHPMTYEQVAHLVNTISETFNWEKVMKGHNLPAAYDSPTADILPTGSRQPAGRHMGNQQTRLAPSMLELEKVTREMKMMDTEHLGGSSTSSGLGTIIHLSILPVWKNMRSMLISMELQISGNKGLYTEYHDAKVLENNLVVVKDSNDELLKVGQELGAVMTGAFSLKLEIFSRLPRTNLDEGKAMFLYCVT
ncbi:gamma-glutamylcysteine synthetase [Artemisia annua]|uniref:Gamma-glutamylcysteine synthetase n=1 Tax=Artemisia annua TaxID=35608 RepID=A0A2U1PVM2_ARTAN|nr:gamma-glutamylcysteine synthetase [Artemisia annua]